MQTALRNLDGPTTEENVLALRVLGACMRCASAVGTIACAQCAWELWDHWSEPSQLPFELAFALDGPIYAVIVGEILFGQLWHRVATAPASTQLMMRPPMPVSAFALIALSLLTVGVLTVR